MIVAVGKLFTVTVVIVDVAEHPLALVTVTLKVPLFVTLIVCVVAPVLHNQVLPTPAVPVKFTDPPEQNVVGPPAVIVAVGNAFTVTVVIAEVATHPFTSVTVTLYVPAVATLIVVDVNPLLHT